MPVAGVEIRECESDREHQASLEIHNTVWPEQAVTIAEVRSWRASVRDSADFLALIGGEPVGSATVAILPQRPDRTFVLSTVLAEQRRRGAGTMLYRAVSRWAAGRSLDIVWAPVEEDDLQSLAFAQRRGFVEVERNPRLVLDLRSIEAPRVVPPAAVEITTWAQRPELARGIYDVAVEAYADVPGAEGEEMESFDEWLAHDMKGSGDRPEATFVALAGGEVVGYAKFSLTEARPTVASHDRGQAPLARPRGRSSAQVRTDLVGDRGRFRAAPDEQRGEKRADAQAQRAARVPSRARADPARGPCGCGDVTAAGCV